MTMEVLRLDPKYKKTMRWDECLARLPDGPCLMAEVGVWTGGTCSRLLGAHPDLHMILVDPWETAPLGSSYAMSGSTNAHRDHEAPFAQCMRRIDRYRDRVTVHRMASTAAAPLVANGSLDLVFIDADHSYEGVSTDIRAWLPKVKPSGWLSGHDFGRKKHFFPGVERAVREAFGEAFELGSDSTWHHRVL